MNEAMDMRQTRAADLLLASMRGPLLEDLPHDCRPHTAEDAYAIQDQLVARTGSPRGWKVAPVANGDIPRCAPLFAVLDPSDAEIGGLRSPLVELEIGLVVRGDLDTSDRNTSNRPGQGGIADTFEGVALALEFLGSRFVDRKAVSKWSSLADLQSNAFAVHSRVCRDWRSLEMAELTPSLRVAGEAVQPSKAMPSTAAVLSAVEWLAAHLRQRGHQLRPGQLILTGSRLGPVPVAPGGTIDASIEGIGEMSITFAQAMKNHNKRKETESCSG